MTGYGAAFDRVTARLGERAGRVLRESGEAAVFLGELLRQPREERRRRVCSEPRLRLLKLCERLQAASRALWGEDPAGAVELAELAVEVAQRLEPETYGESLVEDARAHAWAYLGNARRIVADLDGAEDALARAERHFRRFELDLLTGAEILVFQGSLRNTQGRFAEAGGLLERALRLYRDAGDRHLEGRTWILKGMVLGDGGDFPAAVDSLGKGLALIDAAAEPRLLLVAQHNLIWYLNDAGRHRAAARSLERSRRLYVELGSRMDLARLRWLEGRIALGMGELARSLQSLGLARDVFIGEEIPFDAALVSLDLALAHARQGDLQEVRQIAAEIGPLFQACGVHTEALAALRLLGEASRAEALLGRISAWLRCTRYDPGLRLQG